MNKTNSGKIVTNLIEPIGGYCGRIQKPGNRKETIAVSFELKNEDSSITETTYTFTEKAARIVGWCLLKESFINPIRNHFRK